MAQLQIINDDNLIGLRDENYFIYVQIIIGSE